MHLHNCIYVMGNSSGLSSLLWLNVTFIPFFKSISLKTNGHVTNPRSYNFTVSLFCRARRVGNLAPSFSPDLEIKKLRCGTSALASAL